MMLRMKRRNLNARPNPRNQLKKQHPSAKGIADLPTSIQEHRHTGERGKKIDSSPAVFGPLISLLHFSRKALQRGGFRLFFNLNVVFYRRFRPGAVTKNLGNCLDWRPVVIRRRTETTAGKGFRTW
jgi:hypothetical protein